MRIKTNIVKLLAVLVILGSLVAIAAVPASAAVGYTIPTPTGSVGSSVTIVATGFTEGTILTAKFDGVPMGTSPATVTVPASGNISFTVIVPTASGGPTAGHKIEVFSDGQTITSVTPPTFTVTAKVVVTSPALKQGPVGTSVTVAGTGFSGAGVTADVTMTDVLGTKVLAPGVVIDPTGSFTATGTVPAFTAGEKTVSAIDGAGNIAAGAGTASFTVTPTLILSPVSGLAGSKVTISGSGWKNSDAITMWFAGAQWDTDPINAGIQLPTVTTDINGNINPASVVSPSAGISPGVKTVAGYDTGGHQGTTTFTVAPRALTVTPVSSGPRGTQLLISGANMTPSTTSPANSLIAIGNLKMGAIVLNSGIDPKPGAITIDTQGVISPTTVWVPAGALLGVNMITATDNGGLSAIGMFTVQEPTITINLATGPRGTSVIVSGLGWLAPSTVLDNTVTVAFCAFGQKTPVFTNSKVTSPPNSSGSFSAAITVPNVVAAGTYSIYASDVNSNEAALVTFTVPGAAITVSPASGVALDTITVNGTGFKPYWGVTVSLGGYPFPTQVFTDVLGAFKFTGQVPGLQPGATVVSATDGTVAGSHTATTFFTLNAGAPTTQSQTASISSQLVRVWAYSAATGTWSMYDPTDAAGSSLSTLTSGNAYWIKVSADCTLVYGGFNKALYSANQGWNPIGWP